MVDSTVLGGTSLEIGDYKATANSVLPDGRIYLPAVGQLISGGTYPLLEAAMDTKDKVTAVTSMTALITQRSFCIQADGLKGWYGTIGASPEVHEVDFVAGTDTIVYTGGNASGIYSMACGDDGQNIYALVGDSTTDDIVVYRSANGGAAWLVTTVDNTTYGTVIAVAITETNPLGVVECNAAGTSIRVALAPDTVYDFTAVYESTDSGATWPEILTPRVALTNGASTCYNIFISRDLATVGLIGSTAGQAWLSVGGTGTLTDISGALPIAGSSNDRFSCSADGNSLFAFTRSITASLPDVYHSNNNGVSWSTVRLDLIPPSGTKNTYLDAVHFHPTDVDIVYLLCATAIDVLMQYTYKLTLSTGVLELLDSYAIKNAGTAASLQLQSSIRIDGTTVNFANSDGSGLDAVWVSKIEHDKFVADTSGLALPYKIVADAP
jgi:hypothetical protein